MAKDPYAKEVSSSPAGSGEAEELHKYREPAAVEIDPATEAILSSQIQLGNAALDKLLSMAVPSLQRQFRRRKLTPLKRGKVEATVQQVIADELVSAAAKHLGIDAFAARIVEGLSAALTDSLKEMEAHLEIDIERWFSELGSLDDLPAEIAGKLSDSADLWRLLEQREAATKTLAEAHLRLARPFAMRVKSQPFEHDDLMNEAFMILRRAAQNFDATQGNRFSAYAKKCLQNELKRRSPSRIGFSRHTNAQLKQFEGAQQVLAQKQGGNPSLEDIYELLACKGRTRIAIENARRAMILHRRRLQPTDEQALFDPLDELALDPAVDAAEREKLSKLNAALGKLEPFEKEVVIGKCELGISFRDMAKRYGRSAKTLREIFAAAVQKLANQIISKSTRSKPR